MIKKIKERLLKKCVAKALEKPSPERIPMSSPDSSKNDFYSTRLVIREGEITILISQSSEFGVEGHFWLDKNGPIEACYPWKWLLNEEYKIKIDYYYKGFLFTYQNPLKFLICTTFKIHTLTFNKDKLHQTIYNNKQLMRVDRFELIAHFIRETIKNPAYSTDSICLCMELNTVRWVKHPDNRTTRMYYELLLESLTKSNDLLAEDRVYRLAPNGLTSMANYVQEEQRHNDNQYSAKRTRQLTLLIAFVAFCNLLLELYKLFPDTKIFKEVINMIGRLM